MWFNGVVLRELSPEQWNGRTRSMVVWNTTGEQPGVGEVYGVFFEDNKPVWSVRILGKELKAEHVAEIPTLEVKNTAELTKLQAQISAYRSSSQFMQRRVDEIEKKNRQLQEINNQYYFINQCINNKTPCTKGYVDARLRQMYRDFDMKWNFEGELIHVRFAPSEAFPDSGWDIWLTNTLDMKLKRRRHDRNMVVENFD